MIIRKDTSKDKMSNSGGRASMRIPHGSPHSLCVHAHILQVSACLSDSEIISAAAAASRHI